MAAVTAEERARAMHDVIVRAAKARSKPWTAWDQLPVEKREALIRVAERLEREYAAAGDPPSHGGFR